jgi:6-phosphogluconolactonase (cycloisomerase 2 family)
MRVVALGLTLAVLVAGPARGGTILYASLATWGRIDGFCVSQNGSLAQTPAVSLDTAGGTPRRVIVRTNVVDGVEYKTLYVAETDRVEAMRIGPAGSLTHIGQTDVVTKMKPRDIALSPDGSLLYIPQRGVGRLVGYALAPDGSIVSDGSPPFVTCVQGEENVGYQNLFIDPTARTIEFTNSSGDKSLLTVAGLVYITAVNLGRVEVHGIDAQGMFIDTSGARITPEQCVPAGNKQERSDATIPISYRNRLSRPKQVLVNGTMLYVEERGVRQITAFTLMNGNFAAPTPAGKNGKKLKPQAVASRTHQVSAYEGLALAGTGPSLVGSGFVRGRIDSYKLLDDGNIRNEPTFTSKQDLRMTPVRILVKDNVVYIGAGSRDRVLAYRLRDDGVLADTEPFSATEEQKGSFPNDVALATISGCD